jgi:hypothetical protein
LIQHFGNNVVIYEAHIGRNQDIVAKRNQLRIGREMTRLEHELLAHTAKQVPVFINIPGTLSASGYKHKIKLSKQCCEIISATFHIINLYVTK